MTVGLVAGRWGLRAGAIVVFALLLIGSGSAAVAKSESGSIDIGVVVDAGTPQDGEQAPGDDPVATSTPDPVPEDDSGDDGEIVGTPDTSDGRDHDAVAPGTVTVVLWTSDRNPLPNRATVCVGDICQSAEKMRSGVSFWFDDLDVGWQQVTVQVGAPYGSTSATVEVRDGVNGVVELTLILVEDVPGSVGEPSVPVAAPQQPGSGLQPPESNFSAGTGGTVSALPVTGSVRPASSAGMPLALAGLAMLAASAGSLLATRSVGRRV